jgi:hypothetical protein
MNVLSLLAPGWVYLMKNLAGVLEALNPSLAAIICATTPDVLPIAIAFTNYAFVEDREVFVSN